MQEACPWRDAVVALSRWLSCPANMAASESAPAVNPGTAEAEEETILYDLLVNTEWPSETEVQVNQAPPELRPAWRGRCPGRAT